MAAHDRPALGIILKGYPRISETFISNEILLLERSGFDIHLFSMRRPRETFSHESVRNIRAAVDYLPETLLLPLPKLLFHNFKLAKQHPRMYADGLRAAARRYRRTRRAATIKHFLQAGYLVHRLLPRHPVVHLHAHFAHSPASVAMFAGRLSGLPFSFTAHAKDIYTSDPEQLAEKLRLSKFAVTCSEYNRHYLTTVFPSDAGPVYRIYHGIDLDMFSHQAPKIRVSPPYQILTVARLTEKKGIPTILKALRIMMDRGVPIRHVLIGDGETRKAVLGLIKKLKLEKVTQWLGTQPHHVVLDRYRNADLFVLGCEVAPNGDRDGIPNVIIESMAMGVPVVTSRVSAIPEVIEDGETGLLVPPGRPEATAQAMVRLLTTEGLRERVIHRAAQRVRRDFDNTVLIKELATIYRAHIPGIGQ